MQLVNGHRRVQDVDFRARLQPSVVVPLEALDHPCLRGGRKTVLGMEREGVRLEVRGAIRADDAVLVRGAIFEPGDNAGEDSLMYFLHGVCIGVPVVEIAHDADCPRMLRPHDESVQRLAFLSDLLKLMATEEKIRALGLP